jgi:hypothetical protein
MCGDKAANKSYGQIQNSTLDLSCPDKKGIVIFRDDTVVEKNFAVTVTPWWFM